MAARIPARALALAALVLGLSGSLAHASALTLLSTTPVTSDGRVTDYTFSTPALATSTSVRVMLPAGYSSGKRFPVIYLLHGWLGTYSDWYTNGANESMLDTDCNGGPCQAIVVMPDGGSGGYYTNWFNGGAGGQPEWETYHVGQLIPWIDSHFNTIASRNGRAVAGASMGGFGALSYAARNPDTFVAASGYSPAADVMLPLAEQLIDSVNGSADVGDLFGDETQEQIVWRGHNPTDLAPDYAGMNVDIRTGNGAYVFPQDIMEGYIHQMSLDFQGALTNAGVPVNFTDYGAGTHTWPYFINDLRTDLPNLMATFAAPPAVPAATTYKSIEASYAAHGWSVQVTRPAREWSTLAGATRNGFQLSGSGSASVTTPAYFVPNAGCVVTTVAPNGQTSTSTVQASSTGTLTIALTLGGSNPFDEYSPAAGLLGGTWVYNASALIAAGAGGCTLRS